MCLVSYISIQGLLELQANRLHIDRTIGWAVAAQGDHHDMWVKLRRVFFDAGGEVGGVGWGRGVGCGGGMG